MPQLSKRHPTCRTRALLTAMVVLGGAVAAAPLPAVTADGAESPSPSPTADVRVAEIFTEHEALVALRDIVDEDALALISDAVFAATGAAGGAYAVDDLDGDGRGDLVDVAEPGVLPVNAGDAVAVTFSARTIDDAALWSVEVPGQIGRVLDVDTGDRGLVLATVSATGGAQAVLVTLHLRGVHADGTVRWAQDRTGAVVNANLVEVPQLGFPGATSTGHETVTISQQTWNPNNLRESPVPDSVVVGSLDAQTGALLGEATAEGLGVGIGWPVGDLDADGVDDVVVAMGPFGADTGDVVALGIGTGTTLWAVQDSSSSRRNAYVAAVGDTDGDGLPDLAVGSARTAFSGRPADGVTLFSATGDVLWTRPGQYAATVGDIDDDGLSDVLVRTFALEVGADVAHVTHLDAYRGDGTLLHTTSRRTPIEFEEEFGHTVIVYHAAVDVDGDGVLDPRHEAITRADGATLDEISRAYSGATGATLLTREPRFPVRLDTTIDVDPHPASILTARATSADVMQFGLVGLDGTVAWETTVTFDAPVQNQGLSGLPFYTLDVTTADVDGDGHLDVAISATLDGPQGLTSDRAHVVLDGRTGTAIG